MLIVTALALMAAIATLGVYAAYTNSRSAQRTIATYDSQGELFSSNVLVKGNAKDNVKTVYVTDASISPAFVITVNNYESGKQTAPAMEEIRYTLTARLVRYDGTDPNEYVPVDATYMTENALTGYAVTLKKGNASIVLSSAHTEDSSFAGVLAPNEANSDVYTIVFGTNFVVDRPNLYVEMTVTPQNDGLQTMRGIFKADLRAQGATSAWTGAFSDDTSVAPSEYDGFNYTVSGVGAGTFTLTWDETKVKLSDKSLRELLAVDGATKTGSSLTFSVDSDDESRYDLQFYKVNITTETWQTMNSIVVGYRFV